MNISHKHAVARKFQTAAEDRCDRLEIELGCSPKGFTGTQNGVTVQLFGTTRAQAAVFALHAFAHGHQQNGERAGGGL